MQPVASYDRLIYGAPGLLIGFILGYFIGGTKSLSVRDRIILGVAITFIGGLLLILALGAFIAVGTFEVGLSIVSTGAGFGLGLATNWEPPEEPEFKTRMVFDPVEADEEFDRQIDEALGLKESEE
jgi:hypothetical protein